MSHCGVADDHFPRLIERMIGIVAQAGEGIVEDGDSFVERNAMFAKVPDRFLVMPLKTHPDAPLLPQAETDDLGP